MKEEGGELDRLARIAAEEEKERIAEAEAKARAASPEVWLELSEPCVVLTGVRKANRVLYNLTQNAYT